MRVVSIDYGKKRTGLAVTDPLQIIANGLVTVDTGHLFDYLSQYVSQEQVERIVIGMPMQTNGRPSENFTRVEQFVNRWRKAMPNIPIDSGVGKKVRRENKGLVDEVSATIILQDWMEANRRK